MVKQNVILAMLILLLFAGCQPAEADGSAAPAALSGTFYVAVTGDDGNPGSAAKPWRTIQHAADTVGPGSTVYVRGGVYEEAVTINVSGSAADGFVTFQSYGGETAVLDATNLAVSDADSALFLIDSQSYVVIDGFELRNYTTGNASRVPMGIFVTGSAHHVQLINNHIHHIENNGGSDGNAHGIAVYGTAAPAAVHDLLIQGNDLHDLKLGNSEAMVLNGNVIDFTIRQNRVHDNDNIGIDLIGFEGTAPDSAYDQARDGVVSQNEVYNIDTISNPAYFGERAAAGIYVDGGTRIVIERNRVYQSNFGIEIASEHNGRSTDYVTVRNNLITHNHIAGLAMGGYDALRGSTENCVIVNNTFFHNDSLQDGNGELFIQFDTAVNVIKNNIFAANEQSLFISNAYTENSGNVVDYNLYFAPAGAGSSEWQWQNVTYQGFDAYRSATGNDAHALFADPLFWSEATPDLHLQLGSPAIDNGETLTEAGLVDFDGRSRTQDSTTDIGAFEGALILDKFVYLALVAVN